MAFEVPVPEGIFAVELQIDAEMAGDRNHVFRITITSFLDAYNFDVRRLMKCCTHHVLPSGQVIPFCAYNVLYRDGHAPLPELAEKLSVAAVARAKYPPLPLLEGSTLAAPRGEI